MSSLACAVSCLRFGSLDAKAGIETMAVARDFLVWTSRWPGDACPGRVAGSDLRPLPPQ